MNKEKGLHLRLTESEHRIIRLLAADEGVSMKEIIMRGVYKLKQEEYNNVKG